MQTALWTLGLGHHRRDTMTINVGDKIPSVTLKQLTPEGVKEFTTDEIFRGKKVVLFAVPGAFTPACSRRHLPGYVDRAANLKAKGESRGERARHGKQHDL